MKSGSFAFWRRGGTKGPKLDRRETWQEAALLLGGTFEPGKRSSGDNVVVAHAPWTITLDTYTVDTGETRVTYTRARAFFIGMGEPKLRIRKRNVFDAILENVGFGGIMIGGRTFTDRFVVKGRPEARIRSFLTPGLIETVLAQSSVRLTVTKASRKNRNIYGALARELSVYAAGVVAEPSRLVGLVTVAKESLSALMAAGMASRTLE